MFRRVGAASVARVAGAARLYTPSEDLKKLYASNFENQVYPVDIVPSDSTMFAKFLYKATEPKAAFDTIINDFKTINAASAKLPVFWQRTADIEGMAEFKSLSAPTYFTLVWMQKNGMLELLPEVQGAFETFVNAQRKKVVAVIYVGDEKDTASVATAKKAAQELHKATKSISSHTLDFKIVLDKQIVSGFAVDISGQYINEAKGLVSATEATTGDVDYTNIPAPKVFATNWDDNVETEVLRRYFDQLAAYDAEEAKMGV
jgi:hypothetical protein